MNATTPLAQDQQNARFDVVGLGESMLTLFRDSESSGFAWDVGGAESNVARNCAALGLRTSWVSRLGTRVAGPMVHDVIAGDGIDTSAVTFSEDAPTGLMIKDSPEAQPRVQYYRRFSAASQMSETSVDIQHCLDTTVLHLSGITLALSESCSDLVLALLNAPSSALRSFDLNWRPALWPSKAPAEFLAGVANRADIVFVGLDEAEAVWGLSDPADVRALLDRPKYLVVKDGAAGVYTYVHGIVRFEPALSGAVIDPIGAGDAFAAGFLYGIVKHPDDVKRCQRLGHIVAMSSVSNHNDVGRPPSWPTIDQMLDLPAKDWASLVYTDASSN
ncbi:MAG: sugar kinase [Acidimicrobiales bacterium]